MTRYARVVDGDRPEGVAAADRLDPALAGALLRLSEGDRHLVLLFAWAQLSYEDRPHDRPNGDLYVSDARNSRVLRITPAGTATTVAGNGTPGFAGDGGPATRAELNAPAGLALNRYGDIYIADQGNNRIRRVGAKTHRIETIAGRR